MKTHIQTLGVLPKPHVLQRGFSIVEILIGLTIGFIGIMMMFQLTDNWETRKRTTAAGSDAQSSGSIASYRLSQDIRQAGYGFGTAATNIGCTVSAYDDLRATKNFSFRMTPARIFQGAGGSADEVWVLYGNSTLLSAGHEYTSPTLFSKRTTTIGPRPGLRRGNLVVAAPGGGNCGLIQITDNTNSDGFTINHVSGTFTDENGDAGEPARFNDPVGYLGTLLDPVGALYNLGNGPNLNRWRVSGRTLQACNQIQADCAVTAWTDVADGIVNLQAEYGLDTNNDTIVDSWQTADPGTWSQVRALRVAILARSQHFEKEAVTSAIPATGWLDADDDPVLFTMRDIDGNAPANDDSANDWRHYRYRVYASTIPLRNLVWGTMP